MVEIFFPTNSFNTTIDYRLSEQIGTGSSSDNTEFFFKFLFFFIYWQIWFNFYENFTQFQSKFPLIFENFTQFLGEVLAISRWISLNF